MTNALQVFNYEGNQVRTVKKNDETWFVAKDVCDILGIKTEQIRRLDDDEKGLHKTQTPGGIQNMAIVSEPGLYNLISRSHKKEAQKFNRWVRHEVLPSLHEKGFYAVNGKQESEVIAILSEQLKVERAKNKTLQLQIDKIMPYSALGFVAYAMSGCITVQEGAEFLTQRGVKDMGCYNFYKWLRENEFLCKRKGSQWNHPTQKAMKDGLFNMEIGTNFKPATRITPRGMSKFSDMIVKETLPLIFAIESAERTERIKALTA